MGNAMLRALIEYVQCSAAAKAAKLALKKLKYLNTKSTAQTETMLMERKIFFLRRLEVPSIQIAAR